MMIKDVVFVIVSYFYDAVRRQRRQNKFANKRKL